MTKFYRPPQGIYSTTNLTMAKELGYSTFFWSLAYVDWIQDQQPSREEAFQKLADLSGLIYSTQNNTCYLLDPKDVDSASVISFTDEKIENGKTKVVSASGLIGIPRLTTDGLEFECLINPRLKIYSLIKMNNAIITNEQEGYEMPDVEFGATLDSEGLYRVVKIDIVFTNYNGDCKMKVKALAKSSYDQLTN